MSASEEFSINIRERTSAVFASVAWASRWTNSRHDEPTYVRFWIDNSTAMSWTNRRARRNPFVQMLLQIIALLEVRHNFYSSATHVPGTDNIMADAGSRVWQSSELASKIADMTQVKIPPSSRKLSSLWGQCSELKLYQTHHVRIIDELGTSGKNSVRSWAIACGYIVTLLTVMLLNWRHLRSTYGGMI